MSIKKCISLTSRDERKGEKEGKDYYFETKEKILKEKKEGKLLQFIEFNNEVYGYQKKEFKELSELIILVGGSGTGKDSILNYIIENNQKKEKENKKILISIPDTVPLFVEEMKKRKIKTKIFYIEVSEKERYKRILFNGIKKLIRKECKYSNFHIIGKEELYIGNKKIDNTPEIQKEIEIAKKRINRDKKVFEEGNKELKKKYKENYYIINAEKDTIKKTSDKITKKIKESQNDTKKKIKIKQTNNIF